MFVTFDTWVDKVLWDLDSKRYEIPPNSSLSGWYAAGYTVFDAQKLIHRYYKREVILARD